MPTRFSDRGQENQDRLSAYDRLAKDDLRSSVALERLALAQDKNSFEQAFKISESERKAEEAARRAVIAEDSSALRKEMFDTRLNLSQQQLAIAETSAALKAQQEAAKNDRTIQILNQATGFLKDARGMDPSKSEFDSQFQNLIAGYPMAAEHPSVKEWVDYHRPLRDKFVSSGITPKKESDMVDKTVVLDENGAVKSTTTRQSLPASAALQAEHDALEAAVNAKSGKKQDPAEIARLNSLKSKLGYAPVGDVAPAAVAPTVPSATPAPTTVAPAPVVRTATNPTTGQKMAFIDGKWQPQN